MNADDSDQCTVTEDEDHDMGIMDYDNVVLVLDDQENKHRASQPHPTTPSTRASLSNITMNHSVDDAHNSNASRKRGRELISVGTQRRCTV